MSCTEALALESVRLGLAIAIESSSQVGSASEEEYREASERLAEKWNETRKTGKGFLGGVAAMLGLDYAPDAELQVLKGIAEKLGAEGSMAVLGPAVLALAGSYGVVTVVKTLRQEDMRRDEIAKQIFSRVANKTRLEILEKYDQYMDAIREELRRNIRKRHKLGTQFRDRESIRTKAGSVEKSMRELERSLPQKFLK